MRRFRLNIRDPWRPDFTIGSKVRTQSGVRGIVVRFKRGPNGLGSRSKFASAVVRKDNGQEEVFDAGMLRLDTE